MNLKPGQSQMLAASKLYGEGVTCEAIAARLGIAIRTIHTWASRRRDLFPNRKKPAVSGRKGWDEDETAELRRLWDTGQPASAIADQIGRTKNAVLGHAHRLGLSSRRHCGRSAAPWLAEAAKQWAAGVHVEDIAAACGISAGTLRNTVTANRTLFPSRKLGQTPRRNVVVVRAPREPHERKPVPSSRAAAKPKDQATASKPAAVLNESNFQLSGCEGIAGKALMDLAWNECRWPVNAPDSEKTATGRLRIKAGEQHLFCGGVALPGKRYCAAHHGFSFVRAGEPTIARPFGAKPSGTLSRISHGL